jgi:hypothetical protein
VAGETIVSSSFNFGHGSADSLQGELFTTPQQRGIERALRSPVSAKSDPATSKEAAEGVTRSGLREGQCLGVLALVKKYRNSTSLELAHKGRTYDRYVIARRLPELEQGGLVSKSGIKVCGVSGKKATTWKAN